MREGGSIRVWAAGVDDGGGALGMAVESAGGSGRKACWNTRCGATSSPTWRPGWIVRSGRTAELCDQCG